MSRSRVVVPEVVRLALSEGDFIEVKKRLNVGEIQQLAARRYRTGPNGHEVDLELVSLAEIRTYLVGWSLVDGQGKGLPCSNDAEIIASVNSLDDASFKEISDALRTHIRAQDEARKQEKNGQGGELDSSKTSPSAGA